MAVFFQSWLRGMDLNHRPSGYEGFIACVEKDL